MIASMTAFARQAIQKEWGQAIWELRSVNHRYLELSFKMPENFREWEVEWRNLATKTLHRGKVECHLSFFPSSQTAPLLQVNTGLVEQLLASYHIVTQYPGVNATLNAMELLRWPEVLIAATRDISQLQEPLTQLLTVALQNLTEVRQREGQQLRHLLEDKLAQVMVQVAIVRENLPLSLQAQKQKLIQKLEEVQISADPQRLEQEMVLYAQRIDVVEEMERLVAHTQEVQRTLMGDEAMGRRLDFLMQEMNREANTLAAKALDVNVRQAAIELKVLIEQMREQIQNIE